MVTLSCGHREDDFDKHYSIITREWTRENTKAIGYKSVCLSCYLRYQKSGELFHSDEEAFNWLRD
jgi:hypothetical protein